MHPQLRLFNCKAYLTLQLLRLANASMTGQQVERAYPMGGNRRHGRSIDVAFVLYFLCILYIYICLHKSDDFLVRSTILLMEAILHHLGCMKRYKFWDICHISSCRISSISSNVRDITWMLYFLGCMLAVFTWNCFLVNYHIIFFRQLVLTADQ